MKSLIISMSIIGMAIFTYPSKTTSQTSSNQFVTSNCPSDSEYNIRINISGLWYLVTYNSDGYIINIVEDDE